MHVLTAFRLGILVAHLLDHEPVGLLALKAPWRQILLLSTQVFTINILPGFVVAILIWVLVSFRRGDWPAILLPRQRAASPKSAHR